MSAVSPSDIEGAIREAFGTDIFHLEIKDQSEAGCGAKFAVLLVSDTFKKKTTLQRHKIVNNVLQDIIPRLHAFSQKTLTQDEYAKQTNAAG